MVFASVFYQLFAVSKWRNEIFVCFLNTSFMNDFLFIKLVVQAFLKVLMGHFRMKRYSTNAINNRAISVSVAWVFNRVPIFSIRMSCLSIRRSGSVRGSALRHAV